MLLPLVLGVALAEPHVTVRAEVDPALRTIRGTMVLDGFDDASLVDPLAALPIPALEIARARTWPGRPERGAIRWTREADVVTFETTLPRRWEDTGATRRGLFANGGWTPQPLVDGHVPVVRWTVDLALPDGATGALGDVVGPGALHWEGLADRASLAVLPGGVVEAVEGDGWRVRLLTRKGARRGLLKGLGATLPLASVSGRSWDGLAVEAPLRRRLSRPGAGLGYVSDRAWRVTPVLRPLQSAGAVKGLLASWTGSPDPWHRELTAAALRNLVDERVERQVRADLVGLTKWIPIVDAALYSYEMDFRADLFDEWVPSDRVADDLEERLDPHSPAVLVVAQVEDRFGADVAARLAEGLALGWTLAEAEHRLALPTGFFDGWRSTFPPRQDYRLDVDGSAVTVTRDAPVGAPTEAVVVDADGQRLTWLAPGGPGAATWFLDRHPRTTVLDPGRHLDQLSRDDDRSPPRLRWTLWSRIWGLGVAPRYVSFQGALTLRRESDSHNAFRLWAWTTQRAYLGGRVSWTHYAGAITRPTVRAHAITIGLESSWLDPDFGGIPGADVTVGASLSYAWDNRRSIIFPRDGAAFTASVAGGGAPQTGQDYLRLQAGFQGDRAPHPRHVLALRLQAGVAFTPLVQERLDLGGVDGIRGLPDQKIATGAQGLLSMEYRALLLQDAWASVAGLVWIRDLYLITGLDLGVGETDGTLLGAVGGVAGLGATVELGGVSPGSLNVYAGWPAWTTGFERPTSKLPLQLYATWGFSF